MCHHHANPSGKFHLDVSMQTKKNGMIQTSNSTMHKSAFCGKWPTLGVLDHLTTLVTCKSTLIINPNYFIN
jgi:hypothetical protein